MPACPRTTQTQVEDGRALVSLAVRDNEHLLVGALILQGVRSDKITGFIISHNILEDPRQCPNIFCQISLGEQSVPYKVSLIKRTACTSFSRPLDLIFI